MYLEKEIHYINNLASELQLANDTVFKSYDIFGDAETELEDARVLVSELAGYTYRQADKVIHWYQKSIAAGREGDNEYSAKCMERAAQLFTGETVKHCFVKKKPFGTPCKKNILKNRLQNSDTFVAGIVNRSIRDLEEGAEEYRNVRDVLLKLAGNLRSFETSLHTILAMHKQQILNLKAQSDPCASWGFMKWICAPVVELLNSHKDVYQNTLDKLEIGADTASKKANHLAALVLEKCEYSLKELFDTRIIKVTIFQPTRSGWSTRSSRRGRTWPAPSTRRWTRTPSPFSSPSWTTAARFWTTSSS